MTFSSIGRQIVRSLVATGLLLLWACGDPKPNPPLPPQEEDPIVQVQVPGAYGIEGGNQVYNQDRNQLSVLECPDGTLSFRILDEGERKVLSISGLPANLQTGRRYTLQYRVMVNGYTLQSEEFQDVQLIKLTDALIWLKKDDNLFFVLKR